MTTDRCGVLYVVGTPLGNLDDLTDRARRTLATVDLIAAEDTRRTRGLLSSIGLKRPLIAYHEHNEAQQTSRLIAELLRGKSIALVSDAGTPSISDPGSKLVAGALGEGIRTVAIPGPSAVITALSISGLPADRFVFEGFLPRKAVARRARLRELAAEPRTMVFYEAVHRIAATLADLVAVLGSERRAALARELTKLHESLEVGTLGEIANRLGEAIPLKGEFVVVVAGTSEPTVPADVVEAERVFALARAVLPAAAAAKLTAQITGLSRREIYALTRARPDDA